MQTFCFFNVSFNDGLCLFLLVVAVLSARADDRPFYIHHGEFRTLVVSVAGGRPVRTGEALVAHSASNPAAEALMFKEDPQTKSIVTVNGRLCVTEQNGTPLCARLCLLLHRVSKKTKQTCFCQNCVKFSPILIIFGRKMANDPHICEVHSFSTSPNFSSSPYRIKRKCSKLLHNAECCYLQ